MAKEWSGYIDGYLKTNLDRCKKVIKQDWDMIVCVDGYEGSGKCLSGNTMLKAVNDYPKQRKKYLKDYENGEIIQTLSWDFKNNEMVKSESIIQYTGEKPLFEIRLETNKKVTASRQHKFFILENSKIIEKKVEDLKEEDFIMINSAESYLVKNSRQKKQINKGIIKTRNNKRLNFLTLKGKKCQKCGIKPNYWQRELHIHHIDGCRFNNKDSNLTCLCKSCHFKIHQSINRIYFEKIKKITPKGIKDCYDLENPKYHNFILDNGIISHNSVLAQQCAKYVDPTLDISRIIFNHEDLIKAIENAQPYQAFVFDEAYGSMSSRSAMSQINKTINSVLAEIRQKNLWLFLVLPCFFEMDKYPAVWRSRALLHVYTTNWQRGFFAFYNQEKKKVLYIKGKKFYTYYTPQPNFRGRFTKGYAVDEEQYRVKKLEALKSYSEPEQQKKDAPLSKAQTAVSILVNAIDDTRTSNQELADLIGYSLRQINHIRKQAKDKDITSSTIIDLKKDTTEQKRMITELKERQ